MKRCCRLMVMLIPMMLCLVSAAQVDAAVVIGGENGWQVSMDGMVSTFMVGSSSGARKPSDFQRMQGLAPMQTSPGSFRAGAGLLPSMFGFNVKSQPINGINYGARLGLSPQIQNNGTRTGVVPGQ